jgi:hypothetical protein
MQLVERGRASTRRDHRSLPRPSCPAMIARPLRMRTARTRGLPRLPSSPSPARRATDPRITVNHSGARPSHSRAAFRPSRRMPGPTRRGCPRQTATDLGRCPGRGRVDLLPLRGSHASRAFKPATG